MEEIVLTPVDSKVEIDVRGDLDCSDRRVCE